MFSDDSCQSHPAFDLTFPVLQASGRRLGSDEDNEYGSSNHDASMDQDGRVRGYDCSPVSQRVLLYNRISEGEFTKSKKRKFE